METQFGVHSEVGQLKKVMVCAPGRAHQRLTPSNCDALLFDDVLWVDNAKRDHVDSPTVSTNGSDEPITCEPRRASTAPIRPPSPARRAAAEQRLCDCRTGRASFWNCADAEGLNRPST